MLLGEATPDLSALGAHALGPAPVRASERDDTLTALFGVWLVVGLFLDGWAHQNLDAALESFWTPWHAVFYTGFLAEAGWTAWLVARGRRAGLARTAAVPVGYLPGVAGILVFALGGVGDALWHTAFGVERNLGALLSPTHLLLFLGTLLVVSSPLRSAARRPGLGPGASFGRLLMPVLVPTAALTAATAFMLQYAWALNQGYALRPLPARLAGEARALRLGDELGVVSIVLTTLLLLAPIALLLRRWRLPFGSVALLWTVPTLLLAALVAFQNREVVAVALVAGLIADASVRWLRPWPGRTVALRAWLAIVPLPLWALHFAAGAALKGVAWPPELWGGAVALAGLAGLGLALAAPPADAG